MHTARRKYLTVALAFVALVVLIAGYIIKHSQETSAHELQLKIDVTAAELQEKTRLLVKNQATESIDSYVKDCSSASRNTFDHSLDTLASLDHGELVTLNLLFDACASYFADRKAAMYESTVMTYETYRTLVTLHESFVTLDPAPTTLEDWDLLLSLEKQKVALLQAQVPLQRGVIELLLSGAQPTDESVRALMSQAQEISQSAAVLTRQIESISAKLFNS
ncbi:hypothetical protein H6783_03190 [Candidatus Nomurabacteria bacterium]|nr:hypothetical protein [Candidatus Nomurabacteria bacterium]